VAPLGEGRNVYRVLVGKPEGKESLERPRRRWEDGIKMVLGEIGWKGGMNLCCSEQSLVAGCRTCCDKPSGTGATDLVKIL
jgi:hypothetical protein